MNIKSVFVLGSSKVARSCFNIAKEHFANLPLTWLSFKDELGAKLLDKKAADEFFASLKDSLIISANNFYIFKPKAVKNNLIINYHNSLLPQIKGTNAHIWAIYKGLKQSGISWHICDSSLDSGGLVHQASIEIPANSTAGWLLLAQHKLAIATLKPALKKLAAAGYDRSKFTMPAGGEYYALNNLPAGGELNLSQSQDEIKRLLLAFDLGAFKGSLPRLKFNGVEVIGYSLSPLCLKLANSQNVKIEGGGGKGVQIPIRPKGART